MPCTMRNDVEEERYATAWKLLLTKGHVHVFSSDFRGFIFVGQNWDTFMIKDNEKGGHSAVSPLTRCQIHLCFYYFFVVGCLPLSGNDTTTELLPQPVMFKVKVPGVAAILLSSDH